MSPSVCHPVEADPSASETRSLQRALWERYHGSARGGGPEEELIRLYLPLVKTVVGRMALTLAAHADQEDLHSAGLVGLLDAVRHFDPAHGASFETYARIRIRGAVLDELRRMDWVPRSVHDKARRVQNVIHELEQARGAVPSEEEVASALKLSVADYQNLLDEIKPATFLCLDSAQGDGGEDNEPLYESIADLSQADPVDRASRHELTQLIVKRLQQLPEMQRKVLALYYFEDLRLREIAEVMGVTEARICQVHAQAILAIKAFLHRVESATGGTGL